MLTMRSHTPLQLTRLDISQSGLSSLPEAVAHLPALALLLAMVNEVEELPVGPYPALQKLDLRSNHFRFGQAAPV